MNRVEAAVAHSADSMTALEIETAKVPVATPVVLAAVVVGAFVVGGAVGCAEGHCAQDSDGMNYAGDLNGMAVGDLLQARSEAL